LQSDGNFVSYNTKTGKTISSTNSHGLGTKGDYSILFQPDGNLVIYDINGKATWSTASYSGSPDAYRLKAQHWQFIYGQMYVSDDAGHAIWSTTKAFVFEEVPIQQKNRDGGGSGYCLDAGDNRDGSPTKLNVCNGSRRQRWSVYTDGTISNMESDLCLATNDIINESLVYMSKCNPESQHHRWQVGLHGTIRNRESGKCLDNRAQQLVVGNTIQLWECYSPPVWSETWFVDRVA
jgi:hypothetical protein